MRSRALDLIGYSLRTIENLSPEEAPRSVNGAMALPVFIARAAGPLAAALVWGAVGGYDGVVVALAAIAVCSALSFVNAVRLRTASASSCPCNWIVTINGDEIVYSLPRLAAEPLP